MLVQRRQASVRQPRRREIWRRHRELRAKMPPGRWEHRTNDWNRFVQWAHIPLIMNAVVNTSVERMTGYRCFTFISFFTLLVVCVSTKHASGAESDWLAQ